MDVLNAELLKFWKCLNENNVKYIMVGGIAKNSNGYQRSTGDADLWIEVQLKTEKSFAKHLLIVTWGILNLSSIYNLLLAGHLFN